jgi:SAM-dependent methyltransferase
VEGFWDIVLSKEVRAWGDTPSPAVAWLASHLPAPATVLVPGCGYGRNALGLARLGYRVVATDTSQAGLARARSAFADPAIEYLEQDAFGACGPVDAILAHYFLHLFLAAERSRLLTVWREALRPGGFIVLTALSTRCAFFGQGRELESGTWSNPGWIPIHFETPSALAAALEEQGFEAVHAEERLEPETKPTGQVDTASVYALARKRPMFEGAPR